MAEALRTRGVAVTVVERRPQVLPTLDPELGALVAAELACHGVRVVTGATVTALRRRRGGLAVDGGRGRCRGGRCRPAADRSAPAAAGGGWPAFRQVVDLVLDVVGGRPDTALAVGGRRGVGAGRAIAVDTAMRTSLPGAGTTAAGHPAVFAGSAPRWSRSSTWSPPAPGCRDAQAVEGGHRPLTVGSRADDHKAYYPGATPILLRWTGDRRTGRLLGVQLVGRRTAEIAKRVDVAAAALFAGLTVEQVSDVDLSYTPPLGSPWDALQVGAQAWTRTVRDCTNA